MRDRIVGERSTRCNALTNRNKNALQLSYESKRVFDSVKIDVDIGTAIVEENGTTNEIDMKKLLQEKLATTARRHPTTQRTTTPATNTPSINLTNTSLKRQNNQDSETRSCDGNQNPYFNKDMMQKKHKSWEQQTSTHT